VNFFVQGTENLTNEVPHAFISSVYIAPDKTATLQKLLRDYPSVSSINLTPLIDKVKGVLDRGLRAVQGVFSFTLIAAIVLLLVSIETARRQRAKEVATLRTLGASKRFIVNATLTEFVFIGSTVGLLAASLAHIAATLIAQRLFGLTLGIPFSTWLSSVVIGTTLLLVIGWLSERRLLKQPPTQQFRG
jgi:putative ABC transport system permease protein